jgi:hypothetical protein
MSKSRAVRRPGGRPAISEANTRFTGEFALDPTQPNWLPFTHTTIGRVPKAYTAGKGYTIAPVELGKWLRVVDIW